MTRVRCGFWRCKQDMVFDIAINVHMLRNMNKKWDQTWMNKSSLIIQMKWFKTHEWIRNQRPKMPSGNTINDSKDQSIYAIMNHIKDQESIHLKVPRDICGCLNQASTQMKSQPCTCRLIGWSPWLHGVFDDR